MTTPVPPFRPSSVLLLAFNKSIQQEWEHQIISGWQPDPNQPPTIEQQAILDFCTNTGFPTSLMIGALAGSGKTNTLFRILRRLENAWPETATRIARYGPTKGRPITYCPSTLTTHALGLRTWREKYPKIEISSYKCFRIAKDLGLDSKTCPNLDQPLSSLALPLVDKAKVWGLGFSSRALLADTDENWEMLADHFSLSCSVSVIAAARQILAESIRRAKKAHDLVLKIRGRNQTRKNVVELDFADMIYMPLLYNGIFPKYDLVIADEWQDFSPLRAELVSRTLSKKGHLLAAGDQHQAIYGFTGASTDAISSAITRFSMTELPLTVSFRCARAIIAEAQQIVPSIRAADWAPLGTVERCDAGSNVSIPINHLPKTILCPLNAPLAKLALALLRSRQHVRILGRESLLRDLMPLIEAVQGRAATMRITAFKPALQMEIQRRTARAPKAARLITDRGKTILALATGVTDAYGPAATVQHIRNLIDSLWAPDRDDRATRPGFTLSTIHKAKGLEWDEVGILEQAQIGRFAKTDWEHDASQNLEYVAITRAKQRLVLNLALVDIEGVDSDDADEVPAKSVEPVPAPPPPPATTSTSSTINNFNPFN